MKNVFSSIVETSKSATLLTLSHSPSRKSGVSHLTTLCHEHFEFCLMFNDIHFNVRLSYWNHFTIFHSFFPFFSVVVFVCARYAKDIKQTWMSKKSELQTEIRFVFSMRLQGYLISLLSSVFHTNIHTQTYTTQHINHLENNVRFAFIKSITHMLFEADFHFICTSTHTHIDSYRMAMAKSNWKQCNNTTTTLWSDFVMWKIEALFPPFLLSVSFRLLLLLEHISKM